MKTRILDGNQLASEYFERLKPRVAELVQKGKVPVIAAILFTEDAGSVLYTHLKSDMAKNLGMGYQIYTYSLKDEVEKPVQKILELNQDPAVTGIIVQKPWRNLWIAAHELPAEEGKARFSAWWETLVSALEPTKDVDGLHPSTHEAIADGTWQEKGKVLPATCKAVITLLAAAFSTENVFEHLRQHTLKTIILGKSDLLGQPLFSLLKSENCLVEMIGSSELNKRIEQGILLTDADVIVSATGRRNLVTGEMIKSGTVVIDVGEPKGDVEFSSVVNKASVITPVPGGVGPMTVVSLMENAVQLGAAALRL